MNWQLQEAKNRLSEVVKAAKTKGPQVITVRGKEEVAVISMDELRKLRPQKESLYEFLRNSPMRGANLKIERSREIEDRDIDL
ncbi:MAG: type II toxin-antitoxin system Phd/YefM family antitoxin [Rhodocyclaceae bacterium]|nr:MAG: type II toxin-antitoxin system Phd/YefM family antitoxin [Gammaproteobacteria bacterium]TXG80718.1 MAG: type II toxin-antitoxin system Phd/YefM family antitoxin [Rhodocyclaceae bacterium]